MKIGYEISMRKIKASCLSIENPRGYFGIFPDGQDMALVSVIDIKADRGQAPVLDLWPIVIDGPGRVSQG
jgi:hypothetical protein